MLRTNFSASGRDVYDNAELNQLVILPSLGNTSGRIPYGIITVSMTIKLVGRINPNAPTEHDRRLYPIDGVYHSYNMLKARL
jgi:hypothetical protein